jgi:2-isopropylmalate synthase
VQQVTERAGGEIDSAAIRALFDSEFVADPGPLRLAGYRIDRDGHDVIAARVGDGAQERELHGDGVGALSAFVAALVQHYGRRINVVDYSEHAVGEGADAEAVAYVLLNVDGQRVIGVAFDRDTVSASLRAVLSGVNRAGSGKAERAA